MAREQHQHEDAAMHMALRALAARPRSVAEVRQRLARRFPSAIADKAVSVLMERGLLDDEKFALAWQESRVRSRPRSAALIQRELMQRGVAKPLAQAAVADMDDERTAEQLAHKRAALLGSLDGPTFTRRLGGYLMRRGFSPTLSRRLAQRLTVEREAGKDTRQAEDS